MHRSGSDLRQTLAAREETRRIASTCECWQLEDSLELFELLSLSSCRRCVRAAMRQQCARTASQSIEVLAE
eukprot:2844763-Amphidinium_carterae.1